MKRKNRIFFKDVSQEVLDSIECQRNLKKRGSVECNSTKASEIEVDENLKKYKESLYKLHETHQKQLRELYKTQRKQLEELHKSYQQKSLSHTDDKNDSSTINLC